MPTDLDVTGLLVDFGKGDREALEDLMEAVYIELHRMASRYLSKERRDHTLQTTGLVHEAYLRLVGQDRIRWSNRLQFYGVAAQMMRRILIDYARGRSYQKRGGGVPKVALERIGEVALDRPAELVALDDALVDLEAFDPQLSKLVELRFFGGFQLQEVADLMGVSKITVSRRWTIARAWLYRHLAADLGTDH